LPADTGSRWIGSIQPLRILRGRLRRRFDDRKPAPNCLAGGLEDDVEAVAFGSDLSSAEEPDPSTHKFAVLLEELRGDDSTVAFDELGVRPQVGEEGAASRYGGFVAAVGAGVGFVRTHGATLTLVQNATVGTLARATSTSSGAGAAGGSALFTLTVIMMLVILARSITEAGMTISAPPRQPRLNDPVTHGEFDALVEALIEEARQRARRRRRRRGAMAIIVALAGAGLFAVLDHTVLSGNGSSALSEQAAFAATTPPKIAYTQSGFGGQRNGGLYVMNADGSGKRKLPGGSRGGNTPSWSPDGRKIAIGGSVVNADGSGLQTLASGTSPDWSPDGRKVAFLRWNRVGSAWGPNVYVMNADGSEQRRLTRRVGGRPFWSPDGRTIAFANRQKSSSGYVYPHRFDIYVMNADGSGLRRLAPTSFDSKPVWSPDGSRIAYVRSYDIWVMNADGSAQRRLTSGVGRDLSPSWSPDGRTIVFDRRLGRRGGRQGTDWGGASSYDIYVTNADGSGQRRLARDGSHPLWSTDGKKIAFSRALGNGPGPTTTRDNWEIFVMNTDGTQQRNVTRNRRWDEISFTWSPSTG
jgi:TolB protein